MKYRSRVKREELALDALAALDEMKDAGTRAQAHLTALAESLPSSQNAYLKTVARDAARSATLIRARLLKALSEAGIAVDPSDGSERAALPSVVDTLASLGLTPSDGKNGEGQEPKIKRYPKPGREDRMYDEPGE